MLIDMHAHTSGISECCLGDAETILKVAKENGIDGIVLTNHYQRSYVRNGDVDELAKRYTKEYRMTKRLGDEIGVTVIYGMEVTMHRHDDSHLLVYGLPESFTEEFPEVYDMTQEEISIKVGKSRSAITNTLRLLDLPDVILTSVASGELSAGHARTLLGCKNRDDMILLSERAIEFGLSVRQLEEEVKRINKPKKEVEEKPLPIVDYFRELELRVQSHLGRRVKIEEKGRKKTITLSYEDNEDLDELLRTICGADFLEEI